MQGFDKYTREMQIFELSKLYRNGYKSIVHFLYQQIHNEIVPSKRLESLFRVSGTQVRDIIKHARRSGHPIASNQRGYWIERSYDHLLDHIEHLTERAKSQLFTVSQMKKQCCGESQLSLGV